MTVMDTRITIDGMSYRREDVRFDDLMPLIRLAAQNAACQIGEDQANAKVGWSAARYHRNRLNALHHAATLYLDDAESHLPKSA